MFYFIAVDSTSRSSFVITSTPLEVTASFFLPYFIFRLQIITQQTTAAILPTPTPSLPQIRAVGGILNYTEDSDPISLLVNISNAMMIQK